MWDALYAQGRTLEREKEAMQDAADSAQEAKKHESSLNYLLSNRCLYAKIRAVEAMHLVRKQQVCCHEGSAATDE